MIIQSSRVYYDEKFRPLQIEIIGGKISQLNPYNLKQPDFDYGNAMIMPGLIDIHNHGWNQCDANHATVQWVLDWMRYLPAEGVTSTVPSCSCAPEDSMLKGMAAVASVSRQPHPGANILGIYSEGPFVSDQFHGAQDLHYKVVPTPAVYDRYQTAAQGRLIYVMVAPEELRGDMSFIYYCVAHGTKVALGHTGATFEQCAIARAAGAISFTHTYNGMRGLHHREPGTVGAAMYFEDMYAEMIGDGVHVSFPSMYILAKAKGKDKLISITDSVSIKGLPVGHYNIGGRECDVCPDGVARLANGTIAGSANRLNVILGREINQAYIPVEIAVNSCTCNPAKLMGVADTKGYIRENYDADIAVMDDQFNVIQTYVGGNPQLMQQY